VNDKSLASQPFLAHRISKLTLTDDINRDLIKWNLTNTEMKLWMTFMKRKNPWQMT
jgi:hypothetical protein